jgi:hypothetical protein
MIMRVLVLLALLLPVAANAADAPVIFKRYHVDTVLEANGHAVQTTTMDVRATTPAGARQISQLFFSYIAGMEASDLVDAAVRKVDGRLIPLQHEAARPVSDPAVVNAPAYDDHKRLQLLLPEFTVGDSLAITVRKRVQQPLFPGQFAFNAVFNRVTEWQDADISLNVPASMTITSDATGLTADAKTDGARRILHWHYAAGAIAEDPAMVSPLDRLPRVFASTFTDWPAFGNAWAGIALPKANVTEAIRTKAASITEGLKDKHAEAQAIYAWVQKSIRWVPLALGSGSFEPSSADTVLARSYADGKDMTILMIALLKARDIAAVPVLVNNTFSYTLPTAPNFTSLNHVIVFLPDLSIHADPTARGTPFGSLPFAEYGKTSLRIVAGHSGLEPIAPLADRQAGERVRTTMTLDATGHIQGESTNEAVGPFAGDLRRLAVGLRMAGAQGAAAHLHALGHDGTGSFAGPDPLDVTPGYGVRSKFELDRQSKRVDGSPFTMPDGMRLVHRPGDVLLGAISAADMPASEPTPCFSGLQEEELNLTLPAGNHIARSPRDLRIDTEAFTYSSTWTLTPGNVKVVRTLQTHIATPLCTGKLRADAAEALRRIRRDLNTQIWLEAD